MKIRSENGFTGVDISIAVIIILIFVSLVAVLIAQVNSTGKEISLRSDATYIAINEIEKIEQDGIDAYIGKSEANGNNVICENQKIENEEGFYKTITVLDYADIANTQQENTEENENQENNIMPDVVKKVTVKISYVFQTEEQSIELSTIVSKES